MLIKEALTSFLFLFSTLAPGRAFLLPLLFPVSIKITIHSNHKPPPPKPKPDYHFSSVPVYKEVVVKGHVHNSGSGYKHSYGDGHKYGTSYGDGHVKVYTNEPHVKGHKYADGYGTAAHYPSLDYHNSNDNQNSYIEGSIHISSSPGSHHKRTPLIQIHTYKDAPHEDTQHYKGTPLVESHYKGTPLEETHYKGTPLEETHYKGTPLVDTQHYKGTPHVDTQHYKGTPHVDTQHYKGTPQVDTQHYKGTPHVDNHQDYKDTEYVEVPETHYQTEDQYNSNKKPYQHNYIKSVGGYKLADYLPEPQEPEYQQEGYQQGDYQGANPGYVSHVAIPPKVNPGHTYAEIQAAHKGAHAPKAYDAKQYEDLGEQQYKQQDKYEETYLDDTLPAYKYQPTQYADRTGQRAPDHTEPTTYAGYGTSIYGDSYAKVVYEPKKKNLKISLRSYRH